MDRFLLVSGTKKNSFDNFFIADAATGCSWKWVTWFILPSGYVTAAGQVFHTAALLSSFPAILYSSKWPLGFKEGWCGLYFLFLPDILDSIPADHIKVVFLFFCFFLSFSFRCRGVTWTFVGLTTLAEIREGEGNTQRKLRYRAEAQVKIKRFDFHIRFIVCRALWLSTDMVKFSLNCCTYILNILAVAFS